MLGGNLHWLLVSLAPEVTEVQGELVLRQVEGVMGPVVLVLASVETAYSVQGP